MDNKLTKTRLSNFLAYEWILTIVVAVAVIFLWELIYTVAGVRLTVGQSFKFYFDENIDGSSSLVTMIEDDSTFSYDIREVGSESLTSSYNVLSVRLSADEGDVIFTDTVANDDGTTRARSLVDDYSVYNYERLLSDAEEYLKSFLKSGESDIAVYDNLDEGKIESAYNERTKKRVYKTYIKAGKMSFADEKERIKKLCNDVADFKKLLSNTTEGLFMRYTKYEQSLSTAEDKEKSKYEQYLEKEKNEGRENAIYAINLGALTGGNKDITEYVKNKDSSDAKNVCMLVFDFKSKQPDLQYETISFINTIVRECSDLLA